MNNFLKAWNNFFLIMIVVIFLMIYFHTIPLVGTYVFFDSVNIFLVFVLIGILISMFIVNNLKN